MIRPRLPGAPAPAFLAAILAGGGIWAGCWSVSGTELAVAGALLAAACVVGGPSRFRAACAGLLAIQAGFVMGSFRLRRDHDREAAALSRIDFSAPVRLTAHLVGEWSEAGEGRHAVARTVSVAQNGRRWPFTVPAEIWLDGAAIPSSGRGDIVEATGRVSVEDIPASPRDLPAPWKALSLSCKSAIEVQLIGRTPLSFVSAPARAVRRKLFASRGLADDDRRILAALFFGDSSILDEGTVAAVRRGGFFHWLTLSGLQAIVVLAGAWALLDRLGASIRFRDASLLLLCLILPVAAGSPISFSRVCLIAAVFLLSRLLERPIAPLQAVSLAALVLMLADPSQVFSASFYLTFLPAASAAVFGAAIFRRLSFLPKTIAAPLAAFGAAMAAAFPVLAWRFNTANVLGWIAAPLAIPATALLMAAGGTLLAGLAAGWIIVPAEALFHLLVAVILRIAGWFGAARSLVVTPPLAVCLGILGFLTVASLRKLARPLRKLAVVAALVVAGWILLRRGPAVPEGGFSVEALDVGQGDAILLRSGRRAFLIDGGGTFRSADEGFGRRRLLPKLLDRGVTRLDGVVLSHPHPDHALGLFAVLRDMPVAAFYTGEGRDYEDFVRRLASLCVERGIPHRTLREGNRLNWAGGVFEVLWSGNRTLKKDPINNESVVLLFERNGRRVLLPGDAGAPSEQVLLRRVPPLPRIDLLKVGHHGSRTSSIPPFIAALAPRAALVSCGRNNRFGHPAPETLATFAAFKIPVFRTDRRSDVGFIATPSHLRLVERGYP